MSEAASKLERAVAAAVELSPVNRIRLVERVMATLEADLQQPGKPRRSLLGLWEGDTVSEEDIDEARREMWANFPDTVEIITAAVPGKHSDAGEKC